MAPIVIWTLEEDEKLKELVMQYDNKWKRIADHIGTKTSKQCRRRWTNHLSLRRKHHSWTKEEDLKLLELHAQLGNKWTHIAAEIGGRTDNATKNRYSIVKRKYSISNSNDQSSSPRTKVSKLQEYIDKKEIRSNLYRVNSLEQFREQLNQLEDSKLPHASLDSDPDLNDEANDDYCCNYPSIQHNLASSIQQINLDNNYENRGELLLDDIYLENLRNDPEFSMTHGQLYRNYVLDPVNNSHLNDMNMHLDHQIPNYNISCLNCDNLDTNIYNGIDTYLQNANHNQFDNLDLNFEFNPNPYQRHLNPQFKTQSNQNMTETSNLDNNEIWYSSESIASNKVAASRAHLNTNNDVTYQLTGINVNDFDDLIPELSFESNSFIFNMQQHTRSEMLDHP